MPIQEADLQFLKISTLEELAGGETKLTAEAKYDLFVDYSPKELVNVIRDSRVEGVVEEIRRVAFDQTVAAMELGLHEEMQEYRRVKRFAEEIAKGNFFVEY